MIGQSATSAIRPIDGATMRNARRRSGIPRERRRAGAVPALAGAAAMALEGLERLVELAVGLLHGIRRRDLARQRRVDVLVDRLRDLRIDRRDGTRLRLAHGRLQLLREGVLLLDV